MGRPLPRLESILRAFGSVTQDEDSQLVKEEAEGVVVSAFLFTPFFN